MLLRRSGLLKNEGGIAPYQQALCVQTQLRTGILMRDSRFVLTGRYDGTEGLVNRTESL